MRAPQVGETEGEASVPPQGSEWNAANLEELQRNR